MTGRILVVDDVATNRIVMKVKLAAACYVVDQAETGAEALARARQATPDLILLDTVLPDISGVELCQQLKANPATADIPVILVTGQSDLRTKMAGLEAGADDFLTKPIDQTTLLARVRALLRAQDTVRELRQRGQHAAQLGMAEPATRFSGKDRPGRIALVAPGPKGAVLWKTVLEDRISGKVEILPRENALTGSGPDPRNAPDVFVVAADLTHRNEGLRLLSDLRSRPGTRHAASVVILPEGDAERAAIALDLGASDILYDPFDPRELAIRVRAQLARKQLADQLRASANMGMKLAVTYALTGLHNRRYAEQQLDRMLAGTQGKVAVMMLDLDHFKQINDRFGHSAGDRVLCLVAQRLRAQLRASDLLARMGGEEFLVALPGTSHSRAVDCAERLRTAIGSAPFNISDSFAPLEVTVSVGLALRDGKGACETAQNLIDRADRALYGSKSDGRDQVTLAAQPAA